MGLANTWRNELRELAKAHFNLPELPTVTTQGPTRLVLLIASTGVYRQQILLTVHPTNDSSDDLEAWITEPIVNI